MRSPGSRNVDAVSGPPCSLLPGAELWYNFLKGWTDPHHQERL
jgi:hypothetical protein